MQLERESENGKRDKKKKHIQRKREREYIPQGKRPSLEIHVKKKHILQLVFRRKKNDINYEIIL